MPATKSSLAWIKKNRVSIAIASIGFLLMFFSKSAEPLEKRWPNHGGWIAYFVEHLGAVLIVGMLIRIALEEGYQRAFLGSVNEEVKRQIGESIDKTSKDALKPLSDSLVQAGSRITDLDKDLRQLAKGLTYRIIQNLDENLRKVLEDYVLNSTFVRPEYAVKLKLQPFHQGHGSSSGILEVSTSIVFKVRNRSDKRANYKVVSWIDDLIRPEGMRASRFTRFTYGRVDAKGQSHLIPDADLSAMAEAGGIFETNGRLNLQHEIEEIDPESTFEVIVEGTQLNREHDVFVWNVVTLTEKMDLTVEFAGGLTRNNLDIRPTATHHAQEQAEISDNDPVKTTLKLHQVFLPYQGVEVRWSPHETPKSPSAPPAMSST